MSYKRLEGNTGRYTETYIHAGNGVVVEFDMKSAIMLYYTGTASGYIIISVFISQSPFTSHPPNAIHVRPLHSLFFHVVVVITVKELQEFFPKKASLYGLNINQSIIKVVALIAL